MVDISTGKVVAQLRNNLNPAWPLGSADSGRLASVEAMSLLVSSTTAGNVRISAPGPFIFKNAAWTSGVLYLAFLPQWSVTDINLTEHVIFYSTFTGAVAASGQLLVIQYPNNLILEI